MSKRRQRLGQWGEEIAVRHLQTAGLTIVDRNWRCTAGEIDIVAEDREPDDVSGDMHARWLVLVEVRTRRSVTFGTARQAFDHNKQQKLKEVAQHYVRQINWTGPWRIDAVAVQLNAAGQLQRIDHVRHAVTD